MPANYDKSVLEHEHHSVRIPHDQNILNLRLWLVKNGNGLYFNTLCMDALRHQQEEWVFSDHGTAMHFKLMFG